MLYKNIEVNSNKLISCNIISIQLYNLHANIIIIFNIPILIE